MCIRDSTSCLSVGWRDARPGRADVESEHCLRYQRQGAGGCLLYTSDAADERSSVDLGGRRIIKKKKRDKNAQNRGLTKTR